jgi:hypothetical protein
MTRFSVLILSRLTENRPGLYKQGAAVCSSPCHLTRVGSPQGAYITHSSKVAALVVSCGHRKCRIAIDAS